MKRLLLCFLILFTNAAQAKVLDIRDITTPKGLHVWFVQDRHLPMLALQFSVKGGAQLDPDGREGAAEMLSTLLDEGAGKYDSEAFQNDLDSYGIKIGFSNGRDAFSGRLKTTTQFKDKALEMMSVALNEPRFDKDAIARMRQVLLSSRRFSEMNPNWIASQALFKDLFPDHPYGREAEGTVKSLQAVTRADIVAVRKALFCRERLKISLIGDIDETQAAVMVDQLFGAWPSCGEIKSPAFVVLPEQGKQRHITREGAQTVLLMAQQGLARKDKDWWAARLLDFALGAGQFSSRLMDEVRVKRGFTYGIGSSLATYDYSPLWIVSAGVDPTHIDEAITLVKKTWEDVAANGLTESEIAEAKSYMIGSLPLAMTSSDQIAGILLQLQEDDLPIDTLDMREHDIDSVAMEDIKRTAAARLKSAQFSIVTVGPKVEAKK
jgi:zinc protease